MTSQQQLQDELDALNASITRQGSHVRQLKKDGAADGLGAAVEQLQALKISATELTARLLVESQQSKSSSNENTDTFKRKLFDDLILRKMFVVPSFEIHGGVKGLYDLGPPACALKVSECEV
jgi:glycyl-tRNA synthetase